MEKVKFYTLGCKVNQYETQAVEELFRENGYIITNEGKADIFVVNTCTVTNLSDSKSRQIIRRFKRDNPDSIIVVMGCYSQVSPEDIKNLEIVDVIIGTEKRDDIIDLLDQYKVSKIPIVNVNKEISSDFAALDIDKIDDKTRAYIKVQDGCNRYCSYCIIPYARGPIRSRDPKDTLKEVGRLSKNGFKEIVITGIHVASFGKDLENYNLIDLIEDIASVPGIKRVRLSSMEPLAVTDEFMKRVSRLPEFCDHFHLSLQSGSNSVLKRMNRRYTTTDYKQILDLIRSYYPNCGITTDIIVGFPEETKQEFEETLEFVKDIKFSKVHIFPYSKRDGTPAAKRSQVHGTIIKERADRLRELTDRLEVEFLDRQMGKILKVLTEQYRNDYLVGHSTNYLQVGIPRENRDPKFLNEVIDVKIKDRKNKKLTGEII